MPTNNDEANKIVSITKEYLSSKKMSQLFTRLDDEVGKSTDNESLKVSLAMLRQLSPQVSTDKNPPFWMKPALHILITLHLVLVFAMIASFFTLPFCTPWYIATPLCAFIFFFSTTRVDCQLTNLENYWRARLGMPTISTFVGHYMVKPMYRKILRKTRIRRESLEFAEKIA